jgi:hypothetical protein
MLLLSIRAMKVYRARSEAVSESPERKAVWFEPVWMMYGERFKLWEIRGST